ncbi:hypothetical protein CVT25_009114 [Psilocybe cyanescens]|uniref:Fungal-type protein kinase domain-containing protein n=1 Tax=Psilocybe cyanescens TaxID=93625 RepID=A0A409XDL3_PSICY|nr:hypothetical protein CVT25_009114 [Psilocybe cyanescens]
MAHFPGYTYNSRYSTNPRPRPRRIEEFGCPEEILMAIHDAIESHRRQYVRTGQIHGNINTETIYIGSPSVFSCNMGFLTESPVKQELFQSVNMLSATVLDREPKFALDYADDLESFYYIIAWMSMAYTDPAVKLHPVMYPSALASWALCPDEPESVLEKQSRLIGSGFASECHQNHFIETGDIHGNVNLDTLYIGAPSPSSNKHGFLGTSPHFDPMFQSVNIVTKSIIDRPFNFKPDYLDDLESFYYIIAWLSFAFESPGVRRPTKDIPRILASLSVNPFSRDAALKKEEMLWGDGFSGACGPYSAFQLKDLSVGEILGSLLKSLHELLKAQYKAKMGTGQETLRESLKTSSKVYDAFRWELLKSVSALNGSQHL